MVSSFCNKQYKDTSSKAEARDVARFLPNLFNLNTICAGLAFNGFGSCNVRCAAYFATVKSPSV